METPSTEIQTENKQEAEEHKSLKNTVQCKLVTQFIPQIPHPKISPSVDPTSIKKVAMISICLLQLHMEHCPQWHIRFHVGKPEKITTEQQA